MELKVFFVCAVHRLPHHLSSANHFELAYIYTERTAQLMTRKADKEKVRDM